MPFSGATSRVVHGARSTILYYGKGLRTSWWQLGPGMHINGDARDRTNPFKSLVIVTRGVMRACIGGVETLRDGEAVLVPEGVEDEFWAGTGASGGVRPGDVRREGVIIRRPWLRHVRPAANCRPDGGH